VIHHSQDGPHHDGTGMVAETATRSHEESIAGVARADRPLAGNKLQANKCSRRRSAAEAAAQGPNAGRKGAAIDERG